MLSVDEVWSLIDREVRPLPPVRVPLGESLGRRLVGEILADADMPAFCRSAIDGYAVPEGSEPGLFRVIGEVRPGMKPFLAPDAAEAVKVFTGTALPESGIGLVMVEDTESEAGRGAHSVGGNSQACADEGVSGQARGCVAPRGSNRQSRDCCFACFRWHNGAPRLTRGKSGPSRNRK